MMEEVLWTAFLYAVCYLTSVWILLWYGRMR